MTRLEAIANEIGVPSAWTQKGKAQWLDCHDASTRAMTRSMVAHDARFITITAIQLPEEEGVRMDYHWDLDGQLLGFQFVATSGAIESIYDLCEAANWIEREIYEYFGVDFTGREYEELFLRSGQELGVNLREEDE
jgi:hypothetical protein